MQVKTGSKMAAGDHGKGRVVFSLILPPAQEESDPACLGKPISN